MPKTDIAELYHDSGSDVMRIIEVLVVAKMMIGVYQPKTLSLHIE